jgi:hypothetical protein
MHLPVACLVKTIFKSITSTFRYFEMIPKYFQTGEKVAIMPLGFATAADFLEIGAIAFVGGIYLQLLDGRMYATQDGRSLGTRKQTVVVPVTAEHWAAWRQRTARTVGIGR